MQSGVIYKEPEMFIEKPIEDILPSRVDDGPVTVSAAFLEELRTDPAHQIRLGRIQRIMEIREKRRQLGEFACPPPQF
jgi:hypothetical protein